MAGLSRAGGAGGKGMAHAVHGPGPPGSPAVPGRRGPAKPARGQEDFRSAYAAAGVAMARLTRQGRIIDVNPSFGRLLGRPAADLAGKRLFDLLHAEDAMALRAGKISSLTAGSVLAELRFKSGEAFVWGKATISLARRADDAPDSLILTVEDLTALKAKEAALERQKLRDPATGLANAALLATRLAHSIALARRAGRKLALLVIEIDRFAAIDERQGPGAAQKLLSHMAKRLEDRVRPSDAVARTGGNEIAVILGKVDEAELATGVGHRLLAALEPEFHLGDAGFQVKISMGVAVFPDDGRTPEALLRRARLDMYLGELPAPAGRLPQTGLGTHGRGSAAGAVPATAGGSGVGGNGTGRGGSGTGDGGSGAGGPAAAATTPTPGKATSPGCRRAGRSGRGPRPPGRAAGAGLALPLPARSRAAPDRPLHERAGGPRRRGIGGADLPRRLADHPRGTIEVRAEREGESISLLTLGPGDFMGVDSLFADDPVPVRLRALTAVKLLVLEGEMVTRAAPPGSAFREALRVAAGQRDSHLRALLNRPHKAATGSDAIQVAVYSTKGGSGRTTLALNLGAELGRRHPGEVLVVDLALPYNHIALLGNLSPSTCLARIAKAPDASFSALAWSAVLPHPAGFMALPATLRPEEAELVTPALLLRAMKVLAPQFRYIVFDLGVALDDCVLATLEMADHLVLIATPELASMHDTRQMIDLATRVLDIPAGRVHTVLNHRSPDSLLGRQVVEEVLGQPLAAEFRYFGAGPEMAGLEGKLQVQSDPGGHFSRSMRSILDRMGDAVAARAASSA